ncbi:MAG: fasciclin domain-containing protein [bacterium]|nr:fasciclin domain-containing protein [bacterium]
MRKTLVVLLALMAAVLGMVIPAFAQERPSIPELLTNDADGRFTTLLAAVEAAGLVDALSGEGPFTVLAPTNDAFTAALEALGLSAEDLLADTDTLTAILTYHVIPERLFSRNLFGGGTFATLQGEEVTFGEGDGGFLAVNGVTISDVDNIASNGVVHVLDGVILPPSLAEALTPAEATVEPTAEPTAPPAAEAPARPSLVETLQNDADGRFTTLLAAVEAAGLVDALSGEGPFTVLAPTNDAFTAALESLGLTPEDLLADTDTLTAILTYHVIPERLFSRNLFGGGSFATLQGEEVTFGEGDGGFLAVNGVTISDVDNVASNGVAHVLDGVLLPPSLTDLLTPAEATVEPTAEPTAPPAAEAPARPSLVETLQNDADGRFTTLLAAVEAAGLVDALSGEGPFTILAPTNDAFAASLEFLGVTPEAVLADPEALAQVLTYHVLPRRLLFRNIIGGATEETLNGQSVTFYEGAGGRLTVNGATIADVDNIASNGVIQVLDSVLIPAGVFPPARVRVAHFSPDAPAVDVWVNNAPSAIQALEFGSVTDWVELAPNPALRVAVAPAGTTDIAIGPVDVSLAPGSWTTIAAIGSLANGTLTAQVITEDFSPLDDGSARVTVFHAIEGAPAVNVFANGTLAIGELGYPGTLQDGTNDGVFTINVPAGTYDLAVNAGGAPLLTLDGAELVAGTHYFVAAIGTPDSPELVVLPTEIAAD